MKINDDHMFHGAALTQIAEHPQFTAINGVRIGAELSRSAFRINDTIGVYIKYGGEPNSPPDDYTFTFTASNKSELITLRPQFEKMFIALVCVKDRHICTISYEKFSSWLQKRSTAQGSDEDVSTILVNLPVGKAFRVNMNRPGRRKRYLTAKPQIVYRNLFPNVLFE